MKTPKILKNWEIATQNLTDAFVKKYFGNLKDVDYYFISDEIGGILAVNDYFFSLERMVEALKYNATDRQLFDYYNLEVKSSTKDEPMKINFKSFIKGLKFMLN